MKVLRVLLLCILSVIHAFAGEIVSFDHSNPPFMFEQNQKAAGLYPDVIAEAFRRMDQPVTIQCLPWTRVLVGAEQGEWGVGGLYRTREREHKFVFSDPLYDEVLYVYVLKGMEFPFTGLADLYGKHLGVLRGWSYGDEFDRAVAAGRISVESVNNDQINISRLLKGRVDGVLMMSECYVRIKNSADPDARLIALKPPLTINQTYLGFSKGNHNKHLLQQFNAVLRDMRQDGSFERIVRFNLR